MAPITLKAPVDLGVVPTHIKFDGGLVPDEDGKLPRNEEGKLKLLAEVDHLLENSPVPISTIQVPFFPGLDSKETEEIFEAIRTRNIKPLLIMMIGGGDPMNPSNEDTVCAMLVEGLEAAIKHGVENVSSTSLEEWMKPGAQELTGNDFDAAVSQLGRVHARAVQETRAVDSCVKNWHVEFLRGVEFQTFTNVRRGWAAVNAMNVELGQPFFKIIIDAAHCGDSDLSIEQNVEAITEIGKAGGISMFHASAMTTRGCLSTDDGWVGHLLTACAQTGTLKIVLVELFNHEDDALAGLRVADPRHGIDTTDGRTYSECVFDGLDDVAHRLNNLIARGIL